MSLTPILVLVFAYLLGAIPFGYLVIRLSAGKDIRTIGSGNIGATNVLRAGKKWQGILTLVLDIGKGYLAVAGARWALGPDAPGWITAAAFMALLGHIFTVFLHFRGGKGAAVAFGSYLAFTPWAALTTVTVFIVAIALTRYVSVGSILAAGLFPLWAYLWGYGNPHMIIVYGSIPGALLIVARHSENIRRLLRGEERRIDAPRQPTG